MGDIFKVDDEIFIVDYIRLQLIKGTVIEIIKEKLPFDQAYIIRNNTNYCTCSWDKLSRFIDVSLHKSKIEALECFIEFLQDELLIEKHKLEKQGEINE